MQEQGSVQYRIAGRLLHFSFGRLHSLVLQVSSVTGNYLLQTKPYVLCLVRRHGLHARILDNTGALQGEARCELFDVKHESHLSNDDGQLSYDPFLYGTDYASRFHIKTMQLCAIYSTRAVHGTLLLLGVGHSSPFVSSTLLSQALMRHWAWAV